MVRGLLRQVPVRLVVRPRDEEDAGVKQLSGSLYARGAAKLTPRDTTKSSAKDRRGKAFVSAHTMALYSVRRKTSNLVRLCEYEDWEAPLSSVLFSN